MLTHLQDAGTLAAVLAAAGTATHPLLLTPAAPASVLVPSEKRHSDARATPTL
ncbi:hypothetical protein [Streptomyces sp. NPDC058486]|uniref:hypothetical protein n=1 Tax=unclassified Streptomyces TaxID=2593676 RepID=UPI003667D4BD